MAMNDWNGDGKIDFADDFIEYQIYKDVTGNDDDSYMPMPKLPKPRISNTAKTTDGKNVDGNDLNGWVVTAACAVAVLAWVFIIKALMAESDVKELLFLLLGVATALGGKWLLMGKNVIKKDKQDKYYKK